MRYYESEFGSIAELKAAGLAKAEEVEAALELHRGSPLATQPAPSATEEGTAIFVVGRVGGEANDLKRTGHIDGGANPWAPT